MVAISMVAQVGYGQAGVTSLSCDAIIPPSDSGSGRIGVVAEGPGGRLAWTDGRPGQVLVRDALGTIRVVGRSGEGPGEFQLVSALGWRSDTLWTSDVRLRRIQFFSDGGQLLSVATGTPVVLWFPRPDGRMAGLVAQALGSPGAQPFVVVSQRPGQTQRDTIALLEANTVEHFALPPTGSLNPQPFAPHSMATANADGSRFCGVRPDGSTTLVKCVDDHGRPTLHRWLTIAARPLTAAVYDSMINLFTRGPGRTPESIRSLIERPRKLPAVMGMMIDQDGTMWLQRSHRFEQSATWIRLRPNGSVRDELVIPKPYRVIKPDGNTMWAAQANRDGLETLYRCRLRS